jgi:glycosyltransferase involved in cell wall biosynthesis
VTRPDISVVIPTHNRRHEVRAALRSVAAQDIAGIAGSSIEVIVVFDQEAPDPSLVREFADLPLRVLENQRAPGLAGARNTGATHANGAFLAWLDDDDNWLPGKLAAQLRPFHEHDAVGVVTTGVLLRHETGPIRRSVSGPDLSFLGLIRERSTFATHPSSIMIRREAFDAVGPVDENIPGSYGEDYDWLLRAARVTEICYLPTPFVEVSWGQQSHYSEKWPTQARSWSYMLAKYPEFRDVPRASARVLAQRGLAHVGSGERTKARSDLRHATRQAVRCPGAARVWARILLGWLAYLGLIEPSSLLHRLRRRGRGF